MWGSWEHFASTQLCHEPGCVILAEVGICEPLAGSGDSDPTAQGGGGSLPSLLLKILNSVFGPEAEQVVMVAGGRPGCYNLAYKGHGKSEMGRKKDKKFQQTPGTANGEK